jgi:hypothetical protein
MFDHGNAGFSTSAAARSAVNAANPLTPGGLSAKGTHGPTLAWALIFVAIAFVAYTTFLKKYL